MTQWLQAWSALMVNVLSGAFIAEEHSKMLFKIQRLILMIVFSVAVVGCGQTGALYLPDNNPPVEKADSK